MAATLLKSVRATNCLQTVARRVVPRVSCVSLIHCRHENRQMHVCSNSQTLLTPQIPLTLASRSYADIPIRTMDDITKRIMLIMQLYDKVDPEKVTLTSHFMKDLGLDSLDHVEVIMAVEDEFQFEIPDVDAERLMTPQDIVTYICDKDDVFNL